MEQDEIDVELRASAEVRTRILILAAIVRRLVLENAPADDDDNRLADAFDEREWLRDRGLTRALTPRESAILDKPPGSFGSEEMSEASWQSEALAALAWAIGLSELPTIDTAADVRPVLDMVPRPWDKTDEWMAAPGLAPESEIAIERERAEIWHWRATTELLRREASAADRRGYDAAIAEVAREAVAASVLSGLRDEDFPVRGRSIKELAPPELDDLVAISGQRLRALNWLCSFGASWDDIPFDV